MKPEEVDAAVKELRALSQGPCIKVTGPKPAGEMPRALKNDFRIPNPTFADKGKMAPRKAYGLGLVELGKVNERVVVLDAEVSNSTFTEYFRQAFPNRYFECAIAEQNMMGVSGGLAAGGMIPFVNSFGKFLVMGYAQWEMNGQSGLNLKAVGSHVGITPCSDGPSQMALSDVPYMMSQPDLVVLSASDGIQGYKFASMAAAHEGWVYIRNFRPDVACLYRPETEFRVGGSGLLQEGDGVTIVAHGYMVHVVKEAAGRLEKEKGIRPTIIDAYSLKPLDVATILSAADKTHGRIVTVEDNYNGLGLAVAHAAAAHRGYQVRSLSVTKFPKSAREVKDILGYCGLSVDDIMAAAQVGL
jgi:transketolase